MMRIRFSTIEQKFQLGSLQRLLESARQESITWVRDQRSWLESVKSLMHTQDFQDLGGDMPPAIPALPQ